MIQDLASLWIPPLTATQLPLVKLETATPSPPAASPRPPAKTPLPTPPKAPTPVITSSTQTFNLTCRIKLKLNIKIWPAHPSSTASSPTQPRPVSSTATCHPHPIFTPPPL